MGSVERTNPPQSLAPIGSIPIFRLCPLDQRLVAGNLLTSHPSGKVTFRNLEKIRRAPTSEHIKSASDYSSPSGLVAGAQSGAVIAVEILVEQDVVFPVRIFLELLGTAIDGPLAVGIAEKDARQPAAKLFGYLEQGHVFSRTRGTF